MRWIKLYQNIFSTPVADDAEALRTYLYLASNAAYRTMQVRNVVIQQGQLLTSSRELSESLARNRRTIDKILDKLVEMEYITIDNMRNKGMLITIAYDETTASAPTDAPTDAPTSAPTDAPTSAPQNRIEKEIYKEKEMRVTLARTWEEELKNDEMWTEQLAMRLKVTTEVVRNGISEATSTFIIDNDVPRDRQSYRIRTRQYIDSHLAKIIRPAADAVSEQTRRYADTKEDRGNRIDEHARRLHETLRATYEAIKSGAAAAGRNAPI